MPQELAELLLELAVSVNRYATYPAGHPSLATSCGGLGGRLDALLRTRPTVSIGVARRQLVVEGVPTDEDHPLLRGLADRLHRHHLGALVFARGVTPDELHALLHLLGVEADAGAQPLGLGDASRLRVSEHVRLHRLTYDQLELVGGDGADGEDASAHGTHVAQLWVGLARAALARADGDIPEADDPERVAHAINEHPAVPAFDQVIVGYLAQLARELKHEGAAPVRRRVSRVITELDPDTLTRLVDMGGDFAQRRKFLLDATDALAAGSVIDVVRAAARSQRQTISDSMVRLLSKLSAFAESPTTVRDQADGALRDQVKALLDDWSLDDPNPEAYTAALEGLSRAAPGMDVTPPAHPAEPLRILQMGLEVEATGPAFWNALGALLEERRLGELLDLLELAPADSPTAVALWQRLETADLLRALLTTDPVDFATLDRILARLPATTVWYLLLDRISESASRATRMGVFQRLARYGAEVVPFVTERLRDQRWFVQRNMLSLLQEIGGVPPGVDLLEFARSARAPVRREALLIAMGEPALHERAIGLALADEDERVVRVGVRACQEEGVPAAAIPLAVGALESGRFSPELRLQLLRVLRGAKDPLVLEALLRIAAPGRTLLGKARLAPKSPEVLSALTALARGWRADARAAAVLERARSSGDAELAAAAGGRP